jgi:hypothetical protein
MPTSLRRVAATAVVSGLASLAFAGPAQALLAHDPEVGSIVRADNNTGLATPSQTPAPVATEEDTPWMELGIGALGGLALAGVGIAAASRVRHRESVTT